MKAYKIWHDTRHYIHKDTTSELNVQWTTNIEDAKDIPHRGKAFTFFFDVLGFSLNLSKPDPLYTT
jgi:hypothetical protein